MKLFNGTSVVESFIDYKLEKRIVAAVNGKNFSKIKGLIKICSTRRSKHKDKNSEIFKYYHSRLCLLRSSLMGLIGQ